MQVFHPLSQITNLDIAKGGGAFGLLQGMARDYRNRGRGYCNTVRSASVSELGQEGT